VVIRLMTPIGMRYEDAYAKAHPFDKLVEGMLQQEMVLEIAGLMRKAIEGDIETSVVVYCDIEEKKVYRLAK
jgi:hypothetical protein